MSLSRGPQSHHPPHKTSAEKLSQKYLNITRKRKWNEHSWDFWGSKCHLQNSRGKRWKSRITSPGQEEGQRISYLDPVRFKKPLQVLQGERKVPTSPPLLSRKFLLEVADGQRDTDWVPSAIPTPDREGGASNIYMEFNLDLFTFISTPFPGGPGSPLE